MTMPQNKETFQWDDQLVQEYSEYLMKQKLEWAFTHPTVAPVPDSLLLKQFKQSKQSKQPEEKPKDWRILSFKRIKGNQAQTFDLKESTGYYVDSLTGYEIHTEEEMLHRGCCVDSGFFAIQSVKRLSDGEVFSIGDKASIDEDSRAVPITVIHLFDGELHVSSEEVDRYAFFSYPLCRLKKEKPVLFVTADGKEIGKGDVFFFVNSKFDLHRFVAIEEEERRKLERRFSTEEKAKEYVLFNKPLLSLEDLLSVWDGELSTKMRGFNMTHPSFIHMMGLAKSKL